MDEIAFAIGADPVEFRLKYLTEPRDREAIQAAAQKIGWKYGKAGTRRSKQGDISKGQGIAYTRRGGTIVAFAAEVEVNERPDKSAFRASPSRTIAASSSILRRSSAPSKEMSARASRARPTKRFTSTARA